MSSTPMPLGRNDVPHLNFQKTPDTQSADKSRRASVSAVKVDKAMGDGVNASKRTRVASFTEGFGIRASSFSIPKPIQNSFSSFNAAVSGSLRNAGFTSSSNKTAAAAPPPAAAAPAPAAAAPAPAPAHAPAAPATPQPPVDVKTLATQLVRQEFIKETGLTKAKDFDAVKNTDHVTKLIDAKIKEIDTARQSIGSLQEKFIGLSVANKNGQSNSPQFQAAVKSAIDEAKTTLSNLPNAHLGKDETKTKESEINSIIKAFTALSGNAEPSKFNANQIQLKDLLGKPNSAENSKNIYLLINTGNNNNKMTKEELTQVVHQQLHDDMTSKNYQNNALAFSNMIRQNSTPPLSQENLIDSSPLRPLLGELNTAYASTYRALQENQQNMEAGFKTAKTNLIDLYSSIKDSFGLQGGDFAKVIADAEAKVNAATPDNQRAVLEETGAAIKEGYSLLLNEMKQKVAPSGVAVKDLPPALKDSMKAEIQSRMPQYKNAIYNDTPQSHGFDRIFAHLSSPAATDTVADTMKKNIDAKTKLAGADPSNNGMNYKRA